MHRHNADVFESVVSIIFAEFVLVRIRDPLDSTPSRPFFNSVVRNVR